MPCVSELSPSLNLQDKLITIKSAADSELNEISEEKWTAKGDVHSLVKSFSSFAPVWRTLLSKGEEVGLWQLRDQDPLEDWVKDRAIIIGDAAHPSKIFNIKLSTAH